MKRILIVLAFLLMLNTACSNGNSESTNSRSSSNEISTSVTSEMANQNKSSKNNDIENTLVRGQAVSEYFASLCAA